MANKSEPKSAPPQPQLTPAEKHDEDALDEALQETFPSSDPIAVSIPAPAADTSRHRS